MSEFEPLKSRNLADTILTALALLSLFWAPQNGISVEKVPNNGVVGYCKPPPRRTN